jgi:hypothetical protein
MYAVMVARLASQIDIADRVSPIPRPAGFPLDARFDVCASFAVLHLLGDEDQEVLAHYVATMLKPGGKAVLEMPVVSRERAPRAWSLTGTRNLGRLRVEHHTQMEPTESGAWITRWRFVSCVDGEIVNKVDKTFNWRPLTHERSEALLKASGLAIVEEFGGYDRAAYVPRESRARLIVARASGA